MVRKTSTFQIIILIVICFFFSPVFAMDANVGDQMKFDYDVVDRLSYFSNDPGQVNVLIKNYCNAVFSGNKDNVKYSAFVYLLCSNVSDASLSFLQDTYFKRKSFKELGFTHYIDENIDLCAPKTMDNDCDLATNIPNLFNAIMNDYVNIQQATLYGPLSEYVSDDQLGSLINKYFSSYFGIDICDNNEHPYRKTCRMVKSYVENTRNILNEVRIFDVEALKHLPPCFGTTANLFVCGIKDNGLKMSSFIQLIYNELFYYRLFMGYYLIMIQSYPTLVSDYGSVYKRFTTQYMWSKSAVSLSLRMIRDMYIAYPLHVGFTMYKEDLDGLGKIMARIVTPIYTLYDKLRNVQKP